VISFSYSVDDAGQGHAMHGILAGALSTDELLAAAAQTVAQAGTDGNYCSFVRQFLIDDARNAQDVLLSPSGAISNTPGVPCNAISIGVGFDADEIQNPTKIAPDISLGTVPPCSLDAGT
jgi:hypothetical protein